MASWRTLERHWLLRALARTLPTTGMRMAARMPMMAMTVSSSIRVKARTPRRGLKTTGWLMGRQGLSGRDQSGPVAARPPARRSVTVERVVLGGAGVSLGQVVERVAGEEVGQGGAGGFPVAAQVGAAGDGDALGGAEVQIGRAHV